MFLYFGALRCALCSALPGIHVASSVALTRVPTLAAVDLRQRRWCCGALFVSMEQPLHTETRQKGCTLVCVGQTGFREFSCIGVRLSTALEAKNKFLCTEATRMPHGARVSDVRAGILGEYFGLIDCRVAPSAVGANAVVLNFSAGCTPSRPSSTESFGPIVFPLEYRTDLPSIEYAPPVSGIKRTKVTPSTYQLRLKASRAPLCALPGGSRGGHAHHCRSVVERTFSWRTQQKPHMKITQGKHCGHMGLSARY